MKKATELHMRLDWAERIWLEQQATAHGLSLSDFVRDKLLLPKTGRKYGKIKFNELMEKVG